ncbi:GPI-anchored serine rich tenascin-like glycoprotein, partial [Phytophthora megakarya]
AYCEKNYPGTVCISVNNYGDVISKCTPNTSKRPACRGAQPGLCPSHQSADLGYLNAHCVFVSEENLSLSRKSSPSRFILGFHLSIDVFHVFNFYEARLAQSVERKTLNLACGRGSDADALYTTTVAGEEVTGQFVCLDVSDCESNAADPSTCYPTACGSSDSKEQCTYHGTCTYKSKKKITKRTCMCYAGFEGDMCSTEVSNACDVDCGAGGDCVDGECVCKEGFDGKEYDGKQARQTSAAPDARTTMLVSTTILATQIQENVFVQLATVVTRAVRSKTRVQPQTVAKATANPSCTLCDMSSNYTFDCSTCAIDAAMTMQTSKLLVFVSTLVAVMFTNFVL